MFRITLRTTLLAGFLSMAGSCLTPVESTDSSGTGGHTAGATGSSTGAVSTGTGSGGQPCALDGGRCGIGGAPSICCAAGQVCVATHICENGLSCFLPGHSCGGTVPCCPYQDAGYTCEVTDAGAICVRDYSG
jgi:hypothetical protein